MKIFLYSKLKEHRDIKNKFNKDHNLKLQSNVIRHEEQLEKNYNIQYGREGKRGGLKFGL